MEYERHEIFKFKRIGREDGEPPGRAFNIPIPRKIPDGGTAHISRIAVTVIRIPRDSFVITDRFTKCLQLSLKRGYRRRGGS